MESDILMLLEWVGYLCLTIILADLALFEAYGLKKGAIIDYINSNNCEVNKGRCSDVI